MRCTMWKRNKCQHVYRINRIHKWRERERALRESVFKSLHRTAVRPSEWVITNYARMFKFRRKLRLFLGLFRLIVNEYRIVQNVLNGVFYIESDIGYFKKIICIFVGLGPLVTTVEVQSWGLDLGVQKRSWQPICKIPHPWCPV